MRKRRIIQTAQLLMVPEHNRLQRDMFVIIFSRNTLAKFKVEDRLPCKGCRPTDQIDLKLGLQNQNTMFFSIK